MLHSGKKNNQRPMAGLWSDLAYHVVMMETSKKKLLKVPSFRPS